MPSITKPRRVRRPQVAQLVAAAAALVLSACYGLDELRDHARPESSGCMGSPADLRLWKLHLGQSDYVTLKNLGECSVELGGLQIFFDDHSELFPDFEVDCPVLLPAFTLLAGAEVRVSEDPLDGDIAALDHALSGCGGDVPFNPERGGVTYLCDGVCDLDNVIDVVAHAGELMGPPAMRFRQRFDEPLEGITVAGQEAARFRRVATEGEAPSFLASDWKLERRYLYASFDEGVELELDGEVRPWSTEPGEAATVSTTSDEAVGAAALSLQHRGGDGRSEGPSIGFAREQGTPTHVSWLTRIAAPGSAGYFDLRSGDFSAVLAGFERDELGTEIENGERTAMVVRVGVFHQVELRNVDWTAHRYDLYVDRVPVAVRLPFWSNAFFAEKLVLYSVSRGSNAGWDEIEMWR